MKNLRVKYWYYILIILALFYAMRSFGQYQYNIKLDVNDKMSLTTITSEISDVSNRYINDDGLLFSSNNLYDSLYFTKYGYNIEYFKVITIPINYEKACCTIQVQMNDSWGDGRNSGFLNIIINGISNNYSATGYGSTINIPYCDGQSLMISYTSGNWESENTYTISSPAGVLLSDGPTPQTGFRFYSENACTSINQTPTQQDCEGATLVCSNNSFNGNSSGFANQELNSSNRGCISSNETQTSWYYVNVSSSGTLGMTITPQNGSDDYDFAIWGPYNETTAGLNCPPIENPIRCNWSQYPMSCTFWFLECLSWCGTNTNSTGLAINGLLPTTSDNCQNSPFLRHIDANAGDIYILMIDNYSGTSQPFDLTWSGSATLGCVPVDLPIELKEFTGVYNGDNYLSWTTSTELNNDYFTLKHSIDGENWKDINTQPGSGTTNNEQTYSYIHRDYESAINYYKLSQTDFDGKPEIFTSNIVAIDNRNTRYIVKYINTIGQEVSMDNVSGIYFIVYSDGTIKKQIK